MDHTQGDNLKRGAKQLEILEDLNLAGFSDFSNRIDLSDAEKLCQEWKAVLSLGFRNHLPLILLKGFDNRTKRTAFQIVDHTSVYLLVSQLAK